MPNFSKHNKFFSFLLYMFYPSKTTLIVAGVWASLLLPGWALPIEPMLSNTGGRLLKAVASELEPAVGTFEVAFSPNEGAEQLVVRVIDSTKLDLRVLAYSFTSARVTQAMLRAQKRGVKIYMVADEQNNLSSTASPKARAALSVLVTAGANVRVTSAYPIHHDKVIIADGQTVQTGSYNYSEAAASKNSENVFVNWNNARLAQLYAKHFERNWSTAKKFEPAF